MSSGRCGMECFKGQAKHAWTCDILPHACFGKTMLRTEGRSGERGSRWVAHFKRLPFIHYLCNTLFCILYCAICAAWCARMVNSCSENVKEISIPRDVVGERINSVLCLCDLCSLNTFANTRGLERGPGCLGRRGAVSQSVKALSLAIKQMPQLH